MREGGFTAGSCSSSVLYQPTLVFLVLFGGCFTVDLSATIFSCTEESSPGISALFFICLALSLYADSLAGSSLISFHFLDNTAIVF